jgi:hypothetical protein
MSEKTKKSKSGKSNSKLTEKKAQIYEALTSNSLQVIKNFNKQELKNMILTDVSINDKHKNVSINGIFYMLRCHMEVKI